jgi:hypothetical protein
MSGPTDGGTVEFTYRAKLEAWAQDLSKATGIEEAEARKLVNAIDRQTRSMEKTAKKSAKEIEKEWKDRLGDIKRGSGAVFGGVVNDLEDVVGALGAVGPGAAAFALVSAGAIAAGAAVVGLVASTDDLIRSLEPLGDQEGFGFSREQIAAVWEANAALDALGGVGKAGAATLGAEFSPAVTDATKNILRLALAGLDAGQQYAKTHNVLHEMAVFLTDTLVQAIAAPATGVMVLVDMVAALDRALGLEGAARGLEGLSAAYDDWTRSTAEGVVGAFDLDGTLQDLADTYGVSEERVDELLKAYGKLTPEFKKQADEARKAAAATEQLNQIVRKNVASTLDARGKIEISYEDELKQIAKLEKESGDHEAAELARISARMSADKQLAEYEADTARQRIEDGEAYIEEEKRWLQEIADQQKKLDDQALKAIAERKAALDDMLGNAADVYSALADLASDAAQREFDEQTDLIDRLRDRRKEALENGDTDEAASLTKRIDAAKAAALKAWRQQQKIAMSKIAVETLVNIVEAAPNAPAMAAMGVLGAISAAAVAAEPAPSLYIGGDGDPDGMMVQKHRNEIIANDRLSRNHGAELAEGNRTGRLPGTGPATAQLNIDGRDLSSFLGRAARMPGEFRDELQRGQPKPGVASRTY